MFSMVAILVYLVAAAVPVWLLYHFGSEAWYWHLLALGGAVLLGFLPLPVQLSSIGYDLAIGFVFVFLLIWGVGGLLSIRARRLHRERHA